MGKRALIIVDVQQDFCEGGSLAVTGGAAVADKISHYLDAHAGEYDAIVATKDWHIAPGEHWAPDGTDPDYVSTWPVHCQADTEGADFHPLVDTAIVGRNLTVFYKGQFQAAYSGFEGHQEASDIRDEADLETHPTLDEYLKNHQIDEVDVVGIATDYCVKATALDAVKLGYHTRVLVNMTAAVDGMTVADKLTQMGTAGVEVAVV